MIKRLFILISCILLIACTHSKTIPESNGELFKEYQRYVSSLNQKHDYSAKQLENIFSFFTARKQKDMLNTQIKTEKLLRELAVEYLSFPFWMAKEFNHFEKITNDGNCLMINGYSDKNEPMAFNINYIYSAGWKIDEVQVEYLTPFNKFLTKAICDRKKRDEIRFKEMTEQ